MTTTATPVQNGQTETVDLTLIRDNPWQPRQAMQEEVISELAESVAQLGLLQPPMGRRAPGGGVELAFGHQRVAAIRRLVADGRWPGGVPVQLRALSDEQMALIALTENQKRKGLNPIEEFRAYKRAVDTIPGLTIAELARKLGLDRSTLSNNLRLLRLPDVVLDKCAAGVMPLHSARECLCLVNDDHDHAAELAAVVEALAQKPDGSAWGITGVRSAINAALDGDSKTWRGLEISSTNIYRTMPTWDVVGFAQEFPSMVHKVPLAYQQAHIVWTCNGKEWLKREKAARAAQGQAAASNAQVSALAADPVVKEWFESLPEETRAGVSLETFSPEVLTTAERAAMGTRLEWVSASDRPKPGGGFCKPLDPGHYDGPRPYFDAADCAKCVTGRAYGEYGNRAEAVCLNRECFELKLEQGRKAYSRKLQAQVADEDAADAKLVDSVLHGAGLGEFVAFHVGRQLLELLSGCPFYSGAPPGAQRWKWGQGFDYFPATVKRVAELLGFPEPTNTLRPALDWKKAVKAFEQSPRGVWREVAANLLAYAERKRLKEGG